MSVETPDFGAFIRRAIAAMGRRIAEPPGDVDALAELRDVAEYAEAELRIAAMQLHAAGYSWTEIANVLGVSRQAARQRFG